MTATTRTIICPTSGVTDWLSPLAVGRSVRQLARPDWSLIELDYRGGAYSLRQLGVMHGCSHSSIANKARREGWRRNSQLGHDELVLPD